MKYIYKSHLFPLLNRIINFLPNNTYKYNIRQKLAYLPGTSNHEVHNDNPDYWNILLSPLTLDPEKYRDKLALDFGGGKGRNIMNIESFGLFRRIDGVDISQSNINYLKNNYSYLKSKFIINNGLDLNMVPSEEYDFIMSTIVFQHIPVYKIRDSLLKEIFRVLRPNGVFTFQMGYGRKPDSNLDKISLYYDNAFSAKGTNGSHDVRVTNTEDVINHLIEIGFEQIKYKICDSWHDNQHPRWIYIKAIRQ